MTKENLTPERMIDVLKDCRFACSTCPCMVELDGKTAKCRRNEMAAQMIDDLGLEIEASVLALRASLRTGMEFAKRSEWWEKNAIPIKPIPWAQKGRHEA